MVHTVFKELIKMHYPVSCGEGNETELPSRPLTCEEQNALRYVAGYVSSGSYERGLTHLQTLGRMKWCCY